MKSAKSGAVALVPGKPAQSEIIARVFAENESDLMPPAKLHKPLTGQQKETLRQWIAEGAEYQGHWAFITPTRPRVPPITKYQSQITNEVDAFVLDGLEKAGLQPAAEADRPTLIRRVSLDLTGLPPAPRTWTVFRPSSCVVWLGSPCNMRPSW